MPGPVKCKHKWDLRGDDGHVCEYVCVKCGKNAYQERDAEGKFTAIPKTDKK